MIFTHVDGFDISKNLQDALHSLELQIRNISIQESPISDVHIVSLLNNLVNRFASISEFIYDKEDSSPPDKDRYIYSFPDLYLDLALSSSNATCVKILPYLLAAYYINYPRNQIISDPACPYQDKQGYSDTYTSNAELLFKGSRDSVCSTNYKSALKSFTEKFSLSFSIPTFLATKRTQYAVPVQKLKTRNELIDYLNCCSTSKKGVHLTSLHYEKILIAYIYSVCTICCTQIPEISSNIDYALSAELFNEHTLAFETPYITCRNPLLLKEFFSSDILREYSHLLDDAAISQSATTHYEFDPNIFEYLIVNNPPHLAEGFSLSDLKSPVPSYTLPEATGLSLTDLLISNQPSDTELAIKAAYFLAVIISPEHFPWFRSKEIMKVSLTHQKNALPVDDF